MAAKIRVLCWIDGRKCETAAEFDDLDEATAFVKDNNGQPGGHVYGIDPATLPQSYYACSQYESPDGGSGYEWSLDGEFDAREEALAKAVETANSATLDEDGTKIEVFVCRAEAGLSETELIDVWPRERVAYGKFSKSEQGAIGESDLQKS